MNKMNMVVPIVSIVIPNYNHAAYLQERIESILAQTYQQFELLLLDDCSTDDSVKVLNRYRGHPKVSQVVINEINSGSTFKQWAKGIELARGEWVWIAESDDWCEPTLLETLINGIRPVTCVAFCQSIAIQDNEILYINKSKYLNQSYQGYDYVREHMLRITTISNASQAIFRKSIYLSIDKSFTTYKFSGDWLFWMLAAQQGEIYVSGKCLNYFRKHPKDVTSPSLRNGMMYREYIRTLAVLLQEGIISQNERDDLLLLKLNELIWDHRVVMAYKKEITNLYAIELSNKLVRIRAYNLLGKRSFAKMLIYKILIWLKLN